MTNINQPPFLFTLEQAATNLRLHNNCEQTVDYRDFEALLKEQKRDFKEYVEEYFFSDLSADKRFYFLKSIEDELYETHQEYADIIRDDDERFYLFWIKMIEDTRRHIKIGIEVLEYQKDCPAHLLVDVEKTRTFPLCNWTAQRADLMEAIVGIYQADVIRLHDGSRPSFAEFANEVGGVFGVSFKYPNDEMRKIVKRKRNKTPFLSKLISVMNGKIDDLDR